MYVCVYFAMNNEFQSRKKETQTTRSSFESDCTGGDVSQSGTWPSASTLCIWCLPTELAISAVSRAGAASGINDSLCCLP